MSVSFRYELGFCVACMAELQEYLLAENLYWPLQTRAPVGEPAYPRMTLGSVLLALAQSRALAMNTTQDMEIDRVERDINALRTRWRAAWERKVHEEFQARLRRWGQYMADSRRPDEESRSNYRYEVRWRVVLDLLKNDLDTLSITDQGVLSELDRHLRAMLIPGNFIWDSTLANGFPEDIYWYLWGNFRA